MPPCIFAPAFWSIIEPVIRAGETYALGPNLSRAEALAYWMGAEKEVFVAEQAGAILGTSYMRPNQAGGGRHVCNCGYVTAPDATGKGVARSLCEHSMATARADGYRAMQFNFVVSTNRRAISLWQKMGFEVVGTLPGAFSHPTHGYVDAFAMYQALSTTAFGILDDDTVPPVSGIDAPREPVEQLMSGRAGDSRVLGRAQHPLAASGRRHEVSG